MNAKIQFISRRWRWFAVAAGCVALYAAAGFWWLPSYARSTVEHYVQTELHRKVTIGELSFNPFTLTAEIKRFALTEANDTAIASFDRLLVNAQLSSLIHRGAVFREIELDSPSALVRVNADGTFNLAELAPKGEANAKPSELPVIRIRRFSLRGGQIAVEDHSRPRPFRALLAPIEFSLDNFRTEPKFGNAYRFVASTAEGEKLDWNGEFSVQPLGSNGRFALNNIRAATIAAYLQDTLPFRMPSGLLDLNGEYRLAFTDRTDFRLHLPTLKVRDLGIAPLVVESPPWIAVPELIVAEVDLSLASRSISVGSVQANDAVVDAWRDSAGTLNLASLLGPADGEPSSQATAPGQATTPWTIDVKTIQLQRARLTAEDRSIAPAARVVASPIDVTVTGYSNKAGVAIGIDAALGFDGRGTVAAQGPLTLAPLAADMKVAVSNFDLSLLQPYAKQSTDLTIHRGRLNAQTQIRFATEPLRGQPRLKFTGNVGVVDLLTKDNALEEDFIKWKSLQVTGLDYQWQPDRLTIARIAAIKPYGRVIVASNGSLNIAQVLNPTSASSPADHDQTTKGTNAAKAEAPPMPARIRSIVIEDGAASFADYSVNPSFAAEIGELKGSVEGLTSERDSRAKLTLVGRVDRYAPVSITGEINLLSVNAYSDIALTFRNMELTTFNPYSGKFAGYNITKGKLTTEMQYKVDNRLLDARHHIIIDQLEFGEATNSKDAVSLPIKLAVALLKDRHGIIDLDLPISGNVDDPKFRIGPIVWQVLKNTLEKIVTAPFAMIGRLFGGGEELAYIDFEHGSAALTPDVTEKLRTLKQALIERPQLKLDVPMQTVADEDRAVLARAALEKAVTVSQKADGVRIVALTTIHTKEFGKPPIFPEVTDKTIDAVEVRTRFLEDALLARYAATPAQLEDLGRLRANAVRDVLLEGGEVAPERVFLSNRAPEEKSLQNSVRMELKVE